MDATCDPFGRCRGDGATLIAPDPEAVGRVVARAATARRPRAVYYAPKSARLQRVILGALPERWTDGILRRVYRGASSGSPPPA